MRRAGRGERTVSSSSSGSPIAASPRSSESATPARCGAPAREGDSSIAPKVSGSVWGTRPPLPDSEDGVLGITRGPSGGEGSCKGSGQLETDAVERARTGVRGPGPAADMARRGSGGGLEQSVEFATESISRWRRSGFVTSTTGESWRLGQARWGSAEISSNPKPESDEQQLLLVRAVAVHQPGRVVVVVRKLERVQHRHLLRLLNDRLAKEGSFYHLDRGGRALRLSADANDGSRRTSCLYNDSVLDVSSKNRRRQDWQRISFRTPNATDSQLNSRSGPSRIHRASQVHWPTARADSAPPLLFAPASPLPDEPRRQSPLTSGAPV